MSVATELQTLQTNIGNAYTTIGTKGGTVPANKNTDNLATAIDSIPSGGTPTPLDPEVVYQQTRPADWLEMPTPAVDEAYLLLHISPDTIDNLNYKTTLAGNDVQTIEFGTVTNGTFVPDPDLVFSQTTSDFAISVPPSKFGSQTSDGTLQLMAKFSGSNISLISLGNHNGGMFRDVVDFSGNLPSLYSMNPGSNSNYKWYRLRYFSLSADNISSAMQAYFLNINSLICVRQLDTSHASNVGSLFQGCTNLVAIPQLSTGNCTGFINMFYGCTLIEEVPLFDTSRGISFENMFYGCRSLRDIPQFDTSSGTVFTGMFQECYALKNISQLNTSSGTNFTTMFANCYILEEIPLLNTSNGTAFAGMFSGCTSIRSLPLIDTSHCTDFSSFANSCTSLENFPLIDTSRGTNFTRMFSNCFCLGSIPQLDTSSGTNFTNMFENCRSLSAIPNINTSSGTAFQSMFINCIGITSPEFSNLDFSSVTATNGLNSLTQSLGGRTITFNPTLDQNTIYNTSTIISAQNNQMSSTNIAKIKLPQTSMVTISANATTLFSSNANVYVYVPDNLLSTYQADTYWATLGARLKPMSDWSA